LIIPLYGATPDLVLVAAFGIALTSPPAGQGIAVLRCPSVAPGA
jgi:hypothetical protein